jgi:predicted metal-dependent peptidase
MLAQNGFKDFPKGGIIPKYDSFHSDILNVNVEQISKKTAEEIYDELTKAQEEQSKQKAKGKKKDKDEDSDDGEGDSDYEFDEHIPDIQKENKDAKDMKEKPQSNGGGNEYSGEGENLDSENKEPNISKNEDLDEKWGRILSEATTHARLVGKDTLGMERYVEKLLNPKMNWKSILQREITHESMEDYTWSVPSRRSHEYGIYLPSQKKENINLAIAIDSSGSIDNKTLEAFLSHTRDVIASFQNISLTIIICDCKIQSIHEFNNANIEDIKKIKLKGHGGTSFQEPIAWLAKNKPDVKLLIYLTDGECFEKVNLGKYNGRVLWVLTKDGTDQYIKNTGNIIKMED